jgi:hypothetical protein
MVVGMHTCLPTHCLCQQDSKAEATHTVLLYFSTLGLSMPYNHRLGAAPGVCTQLQLTELLHRQENAPQPTNTHGCVSELALIESPEVLQ